VIAHGRAVGYKLYFPPGVGGIWEEEFSGGYKKVEDFLLRKNLIESRHIEKAGNWHYFSDEVADFFWEYGVGPQQLIDMERIIANSAL